MITLQHVTVQIVFWQPVVKNRKPQQRTKLSIMTWMGVFFFLSFFFLAHSLFCFKVPVYFDKKSALLSNKVQSKPAAPVKVQRTETMGRALQLQQWQSG